MIKLITSGDFDPSVGVGMEIVDRDPALKKQASTIFGCDYSDMKPDDKHVGIHVVALGDYEHFGINRNNDAFSKKACVDFHDTFVKFGHVFRHHRNKDPKKSIGQIKASAYNDKMGRIELYIHVDKEKAAPELERLEKEGEHPLSMACSIAADECSICHNMRKQAGDETECSHIRNHFGELFDDGRKVFTFNPEPKWFDISFVGRPADRIAWNLKVASDIPTDSVKLAELAGVSVPDELAITEPAPLRKLAYARELHKLQNSYRGWFSKTASADSSTDKYLMELAKVASASLPSDLVDKLRELPPGMAFSVLGKAGVVMDVPTFFKYAMGPEYSTVEAYVPGVTLKVASLLDELVEGNDCAGICNDTTFDAQDYSDTGLETKLAAYGLANDLENRVLLATFDHSEPVFTKSAFSFDTPTEVCDNTIVSKLASKYLAYKLAALDAVANGRHDIDNTTLMALAATQNLQEH